MQMVMVKEPHRSCAIFCLMISFEKEIMVYSVLKTIHSWHISEEFPSLIGFDDMGDMMKPQPMFVSKT